MEKLLVRVSGHEFFNTSPLTLTLTLTIISDDQLGGKTFDFMLSNPPFEVEWKKVKKQVTVEHTHLGDDGRFGPGLPRVSDGSLIFLRHLVSKMRDRRQGGAGSGESEIRRYLPQSERVEAILALPTDMFYNTGISTYVWGLTNHKRASCRGLVQMIDGTELSSKMHKSPGSKRQYITDEQIRELVRLYGEFEQSPRSKIFPTAVFGYRRIIAERPVRLAFQVTEDRTSLALKETAIAELDAGVRERIAAALRSFNMEAVYKSRDQVLKDLKESQK